jgi:predicted component of type VI protein secretion system
MKTTVELPDDLYRRAKAEAALRGRKLKDLVQEGLQLVLDEPRKTQQARLAKLMQRGNGIMESGVPDLGSNPKHLENLGRDERDR